jgi:hypothetical protein
MSIMVISLLSPFGKGPSYVPFGKGGYRGILRTNAFLRQTAEIIIATSEK